MSPYSEANLEKAFLQVIDLFPLSEPYTGERAQRVGLRRFTANRISDYVGAIAAVSPVSYEGKRVTIESTQEMQVIMLKEITWHYVVNNPILATQQYGQREVIRALYRVLKGAAMSDPYIMFPKGYRERLEAANKQERIRIAVDYIASMTEAQAIRLYQRWTGISIGSIWEPMER